VNEEVWVVDCSAVAAFLLDEDEGAAMDPLIAAAGAGETQLLAPALLWFELLNVLLMAERRQRVTRQCAARLLVQLEKLPVEVEPPPGAPERRRMHELASMHKLTVYDAAYLELADRRGAKLRTLDADLLTLRSSYDWIV
jgi:predicted nucleic acid-binding protein